MFLQIYIRYLRTSEIELCSFGFVFCFMLVINGMEIVVFGSIEVILSDVLVIQLDQN